MSLRTRKGEIPVTPPNHAIEGMGLFPPIQKVTRRCIDLDLGRHFLRIRIENVDKAIQILKIRTAKQQRINHAEDGAVGANPQRECEYRDEREGRIFRKGS